MQAKHIRRPRAGTYRWPKRSRGAVAVQVAIASTVLIGFAALAFDVGAMYNTKGDLQRTADAAALAAAAMLAEYDVPENTPIELAKAEAVAYVNRNSVFGQQLVLNTDDPNDFEIGRATFDSVNNQYTFTPTSSFPDAVRVRVRMTEDSANDAMPLYFARIFGKESIEVEAEAIAMMVPRDIAIVADLSGSHNDDSSLAHYKRPGISINLHAVWDAFPGGIEDVGGTWTGDEFPVDGEGYSPQMAGPAWGVFKTLGYGTVDIDPAYDPTADSGLVCLPKYQNWSNGTIEAALSTQGYIPEEIDAIMSDAYDGDGAWDERVAAALGLARWDSGMPGGLWEQLGVPPGDAGNGNDWVGGSELTWLETIGDRAIWHSDDIWKDYINNYMDKTWSEMYYANHVFRCRFGVKTFINYLMERRAQHIRTPEFAETPAQPMQAVKEAVVYLVDTVKTLDTDDQMSLEIYGTTAKHEVDLTDNYDEIVDCLADRQAGHYDTWTNMGGGIERAIEELTSPRARPTARKVMFLLTDGQANVNEAGETNQYTAGKEYARTAAAEAVSQGIMIFAVSVGVDADTALMGELAAMGGGEHFHAEGTIDEYSAQLEQIFVKLGGARPVELIK